MSVSCILWRLNSGKTCGPWSMLWSTNAGGTLLRFATLMNNRSPSWPHPCPNSIYVCRQEVAGWLYATTLTAFNWNGIYPPYWTVTAAIIPHSTSSLSHLPISTLFPTLLFTRFLLYVLRNTWILSKPAKIIFIKSRFPRLTRREIFYTVSQHNIRWNAGDR